MAGTKINRRDDVNPKEGEREYGDVKFADTTNNKYPIDTPEHVRAAWATSITRTMPLSMMPMRSRRSKTGSSVPPSTMVLR